MKLPPITPAVPHSTVHLGVNPTGLKPSQVIHHTVCALGQHSCGPYDNNWCCPDDAKCGSLTGQCLTDL